MKKVLCLIVFICILICCTHSVFGQSDLKTVVSTVEELRKSHGDYAARKYVQEILETTSDKEIGPLLISFWGSLTSNIWQTDKSDTITVEYQDYLENIIIPAINDNSFLINNCNFNFFSQLTYDYATMAFLKGDYQKSASLLKQILLWYETIQEMQNSPGHARVLDNYCSILIRDLHEYKEVTPYLEQDLSLLQQLYGKQSKEYAMALYNKSICLGADGQHKEYLTIAKEAIDIYRKSSNPDSKTLQKMEDDLRGVDILVNGSSSQIDDINNNDLTYADCLSLLASGRGEKAIPSLINLKKLKEQDCVLDTLFYISITTSLSTAYLDAGNLNEARLEAENTLKKIKIDNLPPQHAASFYGTYSLISYRLMRYNDAIEYGKAALSLYTQINEYGIEYIKTLSNISSSYMELGELQLAKMYNDEAIESLYKNVDTNIYENSSGLMLLCNKATICSSLDDYDEAEDILKSILNASSNKERNYNAYQLALNNLAVIYMKQNKWKDVIPLIKSIQSNNKEENYTFCQNLALAYLYTGQTDHAVSTLQDYNKTAIENCTEIISHFTESERDSYWSTKAKELMMMNNLIAFSTNDDQASSFAYNNTLFCRNLYLDNNAYIDNYIANDANPSLTSKYLEYKKYRTTLFNKSTSSSERRDSLNHLYELERDILSSIPNLADELIKSAGKWEDVRDALSENEVAIEFTYAPIMPAYPNMEAHYGAFVIKKDYTVPKLILLDEVDSIEDIIFNNDPDELFINNLYGTANTTKLYLMIWKEITPYIEDGYTVYYSTIGYLSNINLNLLEDNNGTPLFEKYNLVRVSSTKNISKVKNNSKQSYESSCLYGNISYDLKTTDMAEESSKYDLFSGEDISTTLASRSINDRGRWGALPCTKNEIDSICLILNNSNVNTLTYQGQKGNEESFKSFDGNSPHIIHLATHGFVIDTQQKAEGNKFIENTTPLSQREGYLMWCGLMMAGSNNAWTGNFNLENVEDGILTADEISRLDLSNTKLVVLSACETARGKIDPVEGVLGLQRAFKKAGAQTIVMSLWKVPDESTSILMTQFYKGLMSGTERHQALKDAMNYVKTLYPDPYYWAGFIMLD